MWVGLYGGPGINLGVKAMGGLFLSLGMGRNFSGEMGFIGWERNVGFPRLR